MALSASDVYRLSADHLRQSCIERGLSPEGPVRSLRRRLTEYLRAVKVDQKGQQEAPQASVTTDMLPNRTDIISPSASDGSHGCGGVSKAPVLVELLRQVTSLTSDEPE